MLYLKGSRRVPQRALSGVSTMVPRYRPVVYLGSLGDDTSDAGSTLSQPTLTDPATALSQPTLTDPATAQWQASVLTQLQSGVDTLRKAELQKWLQIAATLSIPLAGVVWKWIFKKGASEI
jgi:hypothetical protein